MSSVFDFCRALSWAFFGAAFALTPLNARAQPEENPKIVAAQIGFGGVYKLGCWTPLEVEIFGGSKSYTGSVAAMVPDSDGVPTTVVTARDRPVSVDPGETTIVRLFVRVGQSNSRLRVRFVADDEIRSERTFYPSPEPSDGAIMGGVPSTNRVLVEFGPTLGLGELLKNPTADQEKSISRVTHIDRAAQLPARWFGYEGIDTVLLTTSQPALYRPLQQNRARIEALTRWVQRGGRLVLFCGAEGAELLATEGPLAGLIPGDYAETTTLRRSQPLEIFSGAEQAITRDRRVNLSVARLIDTQGQILAYAGKRSTDLPLIIRSAMGLGEVVFVGLDFDQPPLRNWPGRASFFRRLLGLQIVGGNDPSANERNEGMPSNDLIGQMRRVLDSKFSGVQVVSFGVVALLVVIYILLIGPGDYFLVTKFLRRNELTWVTFPLIVVGVSAAAYWLANWTKGDQLRVNQVEIIDVDTIHGQAHGTVWTHFFTPKVDEFDLSFEPRYLGNATRPESDSLVSWLGLPGYGMGGMLAGGASTSVFDTGYTFGDRLDSMQKVPVQVWSTKTITARWTATIDTGPEATLQQSGEELLSGQITNTTGIELEDCLLLYGRWAYRLARMNEGASITIDESLQPRTIKTQLTSATAGDTTITQTASDGTVPFHRASNDMTRLTKAMMFYKAINGRRYTSTSHRYQSFIDLSHLLEQDDRAILLCRANATGSQWLNDDQPLASDDDRRWTYYRFVLPVQEL